MENTTNNVRQFTRRTDASNENEQVVRVLMIEDDQYYCAFVGRLLTNYRQQVFDFISVGSVAELRQCLSGEMPDVILLDLNLPDSKGLVTLSTIKTMASETPIVILTGTDDGLTGLRALALGAQDYLTKPQISNDSLVRCLCYAIERKKFEESALRLKAIQDFTSTLAHDLRVPLIGSKNVFQALLSGQFGRLSPEQLDVLSNLKESTCSQLQSVQKLLSVYKYETSSVDFKLQSLDIKPLLLTCAADMNERAKKPIVTVVPDGLLPVQGNYDSLYLLFVNLLDNAIRFGNSTNEVTVRAELAGDKLIVHVHNWGAAIPVEVQNRLFKNFWQGIPGKSYVAYTGLGLYLCRRIVSLHHGNISCHSTTDAGTTVTVVLPVSNHQSMS